MQLFRWFHFQIRIQKLVDGYVEKFNNFFKIFKRRFTFTFFIKTNILGGDNVTEKELNEIVKIAARELAAEDIQKRIAEEVMKNLDNSNDVSRIVSATLMASLELNQALLVKILSKLHVQPNSQDTSL